MPVSAPPPAAAPPPAPLANAVGMAAILSWSFFGLVAQYARGVPPFETTAIGFLVAGAAALAWQAARGRLGELRVRPAAWLHGVGGLFGFHVLYFAAMTQAPPAQAVVIEYCWPLLVVVLSAPVLGLRLRPAHLLGVSLGFAGCLLLAGRVGRFAWAFWPGYALSFASALVWAGYSVLARRLAGVPTGAVAGYYVATAVLAGACHLAFETTVVPDRGSAVAIGLLGIGPMGLAYLLWDWAAKRGDPRVLGTLGNAAPVANYLLLCAGGFAPFGPLPAAAACLVAAGGVIAARPSAARGGPVAA